MVKDIKLLLERFQYSPGSLVEGKLQVTVDKPKKYSNIVVTLLGRAKVRWTETTGSGEHRTETTYSNSETYVNLQAVVWKAENTPDGTLAAATYHFPFSFQLPQTLPPSYEGLYGQLRYDIEAKIHHSGVINTLLKSKHAIQARLTIDDRSPGVDLLHLHSEPVSAEKSKRLTFFCSNQGSISATVSLPRTGFYPGETIPIGLHINNESSRQIRIASALHRRDTFIASSGKQRLLFKTVARTLSSPLSAGGIFSFEDKNLMVPINIQPTMRSCSCISVEYVLEVIVRIPWSINMKITIPVAIANLRQVSTLARSSVAGPQAASSYGFQPQQQPYQPPLNQYTSPQPPQALGFQAPYSPHGSQFPAAPQEQYSSQALGFQAPYSPHGSQFPAAPQEQRVDPNLPTYSEAIAKL